MFLIREVIIGRGESDAYIFISIFHPDYDYTNNCDLFEVLLYRIILHNKIKFHFYNIRLINMFTITHFMIYKPNLNFMKITYFIKRLF